MQARTQASIPPSLPPSSLAHLPGHPLYSVDQAGFKFSHLLNFPRVRHASVESLGVNCYAGPLEAGFLSVLGCVYPSRVWVGGGTKQQRSFGIVGGLC